MSYNDDEVTGFVEEEPVTIRVIAPATLDEGYTFDVLVDGLPYTVEVPKGGVKKDQEFDVSYDPQFHGALPYEDETKLYDDDDDTKLNEQPTAPVQTMSQDEEDTAEAEKKDEENTWYDETTGAPIGRWRTSLCSCCDVLTQSTFWMGLCCTPVLIAQLITRLGLKWNGRSGVSKEEMSLSFNRIILSMMITLALWKIPVVGDILMLIFYLFVVVHIGSHVRRHMRQKYKIPPRLPTRCGKRMEDCCCMLLCCCCSTIQMARHTHDDKEFPGHGCTTTGLGMDAPLIV